MTGFGWDPTENVHILKWPAKFKIWDVSEPCHVFEECRVRESSQIFSYSSSNIFNVRGNKNNVVVARKSAKIICSRKSVHGVLDPILSARAYTVQPEEVRELQNHMI